MKFLKLFARCLILAGTAVSASYAAEPVLGKDYTLIDPPRPVSTGSPRAQIAVLDQLIFMARQGRNKEP